MSQSARGLTDEDRREIAQIAEHAGDYYVTESECARMRRRWRESDEKRWKLVEESDMAYAEGTWRYHVYGRCDHDDVDEAPVEAWGGDG